MNGKFLDGPRTSRQDWLFQLQRIFLITKVNRTSRQPAENLKQVLKGKNIALENNVRQQTQAEIYNQEIHN